MRDQPEDVFRHLIFTWNARHPVRFFESESNGGFFKFQKSIHDSMSITAARSWVSMFC
jgi:hypothetical protein